MYGTSSASTTSSSRAVPAERRVRVVRLLRPRRASPAFGFALRGGNEHATGFFVSKVDFNSEAHLQGLKIGDQLVSVNGYRVDDAVHSELIHYLASQSRLKIKVRHVGMLPIREKPHEPLSWQFISEGVSMGSDVSSSPTICHDTERMQNLRLSILVPPRAKLGCGICKGPEWKPGIFVQFVREGGIAREAGLRPGDQILSCNGHDFTNIPFNDAVAAMKVIGRLELMVREGAGTELVSPESSGYNSSASSAAGERSPAPLGSVPLAPLAPPAALRRRLASVAEEAADRADRLTTNRLKRRTWGSIDFNWKNNDVHNFDVPSDIEPDYDSPSIPNNPNTFNSKNNSKNNRQEYISSPSNRTIINLTEDGATIQCSYDDPKKTNLSNSQSNKDGKTIVVEVHHSNTQLCNTKNHCHPPPPKKEPNCDTASLSSTNTLSNAIAEEIQRRKLTKKNSSSENNLVSAPPPVPKKPNQPKTDEKMKHHDALIDEFKKVHRKMFMNQENKDDQPNKLQENDSADRQPTLPLRKVEQPVSQENHNNASNGKTVQQTNDNHVQNSNGNHIAHTNGFNRLQPVKATANSNLTSFANGNHAPQVNGKHTTQPNGNHKPNKDGVPPPPPPMPISNGSQNGERTKPEDRQKSIKEKGLELLNNTQSRNSTLSRTPTPDYNDKVAAPALIKLNGKEDKAELESLESFKLKSPLNTEPKPPSNYFVSPPNGTATMKKHLRPISVTIGEYACGGGNRKEPSKLEFLNGDKVDGNRNGRNDEPITNRLQSELALTLSRSNLRKKTDVTDRSVDLKPVIKYPDASLDKFFHMRYGNNILPLPPTITIPKAKN